MSKSPAEFPFAPGPCGQPPAEYARLRDADPVAPVLLPSGSHAGLVTRYEDVLTVLADPRFSRNLRYPGAPRLSSGLDISDDPGSLFNMDPPEHTRLRRIVQGAFTPRRVEAWRPRAQRIADELLDTMSRMERPVDLSRAFAFPLSIRVICGMLGVPDENLEQFRKWSDITLSVSKHSLEEMVEAFLAAREHLAELVAGKRASPGDDLLDALITARDEEDRLTEEELVAMAHSVLSAGHETSLNVISRGVLTLCQYPDQAARLREDPALLEGAVDEILRYNVPGDGGLLRVAKEEVELSGVTIAPGEAVIGASAAANRDPGQFPDPDRFDISRGNASSHASFGRGPHYCLGAHLAKMEIQVAIGSLIQRFPTLRLAVDPAELRWTTGLLVNHLEELPVAW